MIRNRKKYTFFRTWKWSNLWSAVTFATGTSENPVHGLVVVYIGEFACSPYKRVRLQSISEFACSPYRWNPNMQKSMLQNLEISETFSSITFPEITFREKTRRVGLSEHVYWPGKHTPGVCHLSRASYDPATFRFTIHGRDTASAAGATVQQPASKTQVIR